MFCMKVKETHRKGNRDFLNMLRLGKGEGQKKGGGKRRGQGDKDQETEIKSFCTQTPKEQGTDFTLWLPPGPARPPVRLPDN